MQLSSFVDDFKRNFKNRNFIIQPGCACCFR